MKLRSEGKICDESVRRIVRKKEASTRSESQPELRVEYKVNETRKSRQDAETKYRKMRLNKSNMRENGDKLSRKKVASLTSIFKGSVPSNIS